MLDVKIIAAKIQPHVIVFKRNLELITKEIMGEQLPADIIDPVFCVFYNVLMTTIELPDGRQIDTYSDEIDCSVRHFWGGNIIQSKKKWVTKFLRQFPEFPGRPWENNSQLKFIHFSLNCGNCDEQHHFCFPYTPDDIVHTID